MAISNYQSEAIKDIYGDEIIQNSEASVNEIENYYKMNSVYDNIIEIPDILTINSSYHSLSKYVLNNERTINLNEDMMSRIYIPPIISQEYSSYFKLFNEKDIDWENAYLKYAKNSLDMSLPFTYINLKLNTNPLNIEIVKKSNGNLLDTGNSYIYTNGIPERITNTHDLLDIVNYLLVKIKLLYFMYDVVKKQYIVMSNYKEQLSHQNNN